MAQLAIKGHLTRGKEVIEILEMLGGKIRLDRPAGNEMFSWYYINEDGYIDDMHYPLFQDVTYFILEIFLEKFPYKVGDEVQLKGSTSFGSVFGIEKMRWVGNQVEYTIKRLRYKKLPIEDNITRLWYKNFHREVTAQDLQPYKEETMEENLTIQDMRDNNAEWLLHILKGMSSLDMFTFVNKLYNKLDNQKYPKTYEECCEVVGAQSTRHWIYTIKDKLDYPHEIKIINYLDALRQLLICRDAYWKIAGDWKPNFGETFNHGIGMYYGVVEKIAVTGNRILVFPTEEMRDAFFENFRDLIEQCKELL